MRQILVYDLPTRIFHWLFAGMFLGAFAIAKTVDDDSSIFMMHMLVGLVMGLLVFLRLVWGLIGTRYARLSGFALRPKDLLAYFLGIARGDRALWAGHNPASSWAALIMMGITLGLVASGLWMVSDQGGFLTEDIHEVLGNGFLVVAVLHVAGVVLHTVLHRDMIGLSMIDGKKAGIESAEAITSARVGTGVLMVVLVAIFAAYLFQNFDSDTATLKVFGQTLELIEE